MFFFIKSFLFGKNTLPTFVSASRTRADCEKFNLVSWKFNLTSKMKSCQFDMNRCRWLTARYVCGRDSTLCAYCNQLTNCTSLSAQFTILMYIQLICVKLVERYMLFWNVILSKRVNM